MADIESLLKALTLEEKAALTAGEDMFSTVGIERVGIPKIRMTDGPAGAKGASLPGLDGVASTCILSGSAIGATWDPGLAEALGRLVGREAYERGCQGLLAPTVNLHRSPLAGRNFECFSEDPLLSGRLAAGYVRGVQSNGVFAAVKHLVANEAEFERSSISSVVDERSLGQLYLVPFEMAVRDGGALAIMTSYNRLNGKWLTERPDFLTGILRDEWGFQGLVMTDWWAVVDPANSLSAGLDLEMPGPARSLGINVIASIEAGLVDKSDLDAAVDRLLSGLDRIGALDGPAPPIAPVPPTPEDLALLRAGAADAAILLRNDGILPLDSAGLSSVAVIGGPAADACVGGGGSAQVVPYRAQSPLDRLREALGENVKVSYERGCDIDRWATLIGTSWLKTPTGFELEVFEGLEHSGPAVTSRQIDHLESFVVAALDQNYPSGDWSVRVSGTVVPEESGRFQLALLHFGKARMLVNGVVVLDSETGQPISDTEFHGHRRELEGEINLDAGQPLEVQVEYWRTESPLSGFRAGCRRLDTDVLLESAVTKASDADVAVVIVGTNASWKTEGHDRKSFQLPGLQDEMVHRIAAANRRTVVVVNSGAPVDLPWADEVAAVLQVGFAGQEMDAAIADVLTGRSEPGGRLPTTIPKRIEHNPSFDNFAGENGEVLYGERLFMGYRGYEHRSIEPRYAFGHGMSYTTFEIGPPTASTDIFRPGEPLTIRIPVTNTGQRKGSEVVQCYVAPRSPRLARPPKELKGFAKVRLAPAKTTQVEILLDDRSFAYWDPGQVDVAEINSRLKAAAPGGWTATIERRAPGWQIAPGAYDILIGRSSDQIVCSLTVTVA